MTADQDGVALAEFTAALSLGCTSDAHEQAGLFGDEIARAVRAGQVSPVEVVQAHLAQIGRLEPRIRAFQVVLAEQALAQARALAARLIWRGCRWPAFRSR